MLQIRGYSTFFSTNRLASRRFLSLRAPVKLFWESCRAERGQAVHRQRFVHHDRQQLRQMSLSESNRTEPAHGHGETAGPSGHEGGGHGIRGIEPNNR